MRTSKNRKIFSANSNNEQGTINILLIFSANYEQRTIKRG